MALFRKFFYRKPPDGLLEISERVYVFDCCFTTNVVEEENYKSYISGVVGQLRAHLPDASFMVFNYHEGQNPSQIADVLSEHDMTVVDYPRQYEGCPLLTIEMINHCVRSGDSWLLLGQRNVLLMHCERGGGPILAFMLAALLIYRNIYNGEQKTLDMIYKQAPRELQLMAPLNPLPSQLRYLQYVSRRNLSLEWPPLDRALMMDCIILRLIPNMDGDSGCRPVIRIYGQDPSLDADRTTKVLFSTLKKSRIVRQFKQTESELVKIDIHCHVQGDVVLECISLDDDLEREQMMFRVMFSTAFIRSNILMLNRDEIDTLWDSKDKFPKDFRTEVLFSEMDSTSSDAAIEMPVIGEKAGLPVEAFATVQEIFSSLDWTESETDGTQNVPEKLTASTVQKLNIAMDSRQSSKADNLEGSSPKFEEKAISTLSENSGEASDGNSPTAFSPQQLSKKENLKILENKIDSEPTNAVVLETKSRPSLATSLDENTIPKKTLSGTLLPTIQQPTQTKIISPRIIQSSRPTTGLYNSSFQTLPKPMQRFHSSASSLGITALLHDHDEYRTDAFPQVNSFSSLKSDSSVVSVTHASKLEENAIGSPALLQPLPQLPPTLPPQILHSQTRPSFTKSPSLNVGTTLSVPPSPPPPPLSPPPLSFTKSTALNVGTTLSVPPSPPSPPPPSFTKSTSSNVGTTLSVSPSPPPPPFPPPPSSTKSTSSNVGTTLSVPPSPPPPPPSLTRSQSSNVGTTSSAPPPPSPSPSFRPSPSDTGITISKPPPPPPPPLKNSSIPNLSTSVPPPPPPPKVMPKNFGSTTSPKAPPVPPPPMPFGNGLPKANGHVPPPLGPLGPKGRIPSRPTPRTHGQTKKANLKPYHWLKLTRVMQGSLWADAQKSDEESKAPDFDILELENLFAAAVPNSENEGIGAKSSRRVPGLKNDKVQLIELRRAYNCEIMLSKVKIPLPELMSAVLALDDSALDIDQVENLIKFCPTKEEMDQLKGYKGDQENLGKCEKFFFELMKVPRVESKLRVFSFKMQFKSQLSDLKKNLQTVNSTSEEIRTSAKLKRVMQTILSLGNALNQGTARGSAVGFRLDSLLKLTDTRARNSKMTLMHYLCKVLAEKLPELLDFPKDLVSLEGSTKIQLKFLAEEMQAISKGLEKVVQELTTSGNDGPVSETFCKILKQFIAYAESEARSLASLYSIVGRNADALAMYFGEDPAKCPFEQVVSTLLNFVRMFIRAHEENCKQLELEKKKAEKEAENGNKLKIGSRPKDLSTVPSSKTARAHNL